LAATIGINVQGKASMDTIKEPTKVLETGPGKSWWSHLEYERLAGGDMVGKLETKG